MDIIAVLTKIVQRHEQVLARLEAESTQLRQTPLRVSGTIQTLEERMQQRGDADYGDPAAAPAAGAAGDDA